MTTIAHIIIGTLFIIIVAFAVLYYHIQNNSHLIRTTDTVGIYGTAAKTNQYVPVYFQDFVLTLSLVEVKESEDTGVGYLEFVYDITSNSSDETTRTSWTTGGEISPAGFTIDEVPYLIYLRSDEDGTDIKDGYIVVRKNQ